MSEGGATGDDPLATIDRAFASGGPLERAIPGYRPREQQIALAREVARAIDEAAVLVAEAGTGTGKTVAYLVPALIYGGKAIISTGTKTLQDQLFHRDLPAVRDALGVPVQAALLKGRANYVCPYHLERNLREGRLTSREAVDHLQSIARFAKRTLTGDRAELAAVPEDSSAWSLATSTRENCLGQSCPDHKDCFVMKARRAALEADVVVVNHHLFFADAMLRDEGMAELLPAANTVILDEAHQLPDTASLFFGESVSTGQVLDLVRDALAESLTAARDVAELAPILRATDKAARDVRLAVPLKEARLATARLAEFKTLMPAVGVLADTLLRLSKALEALADRSEGLASCARRAAESLAAIRRWQRGEDSGADADEESAWEEDGVEDDGAPVDPSRTLIRWVDVYPQSLALHATPLSVAGQFRKQVAAGRKAWILTSATLAVGAAFTLYQERMGLEDARTAIWASPFDYATNALLYAPLGLPDPNDPGFTEAVVAAALPVLRASRGRAFLLFTTLRGMRRAHELLGEAFRREGLDYPLLVQGQGSKSDLLDRFRALGNAVLVASASFWEGVDVRGEALSLVVIDKLPFAPPDDPVLAARLAHLARAGRNAFLEYQVPQAAITLKQGAGRLIRDERDRGVLMICDPRLAGKPYGRRIVASLPPMRRTRSLADVEAFFGEPPAGA